MARHIVWQPLDGTAAAASLLSRLQHPPYPGRGRRMVNGWSTSRTRPRRSSASRSCASAHRPRPRPARRPARLLQPHLSPDGRWLAYVVVGAGTARRLHPPARGRRPTAAHSRRRRSATLERRRHRDFFDRRGGPDADPHSDDARAADSAASKSSSTPGLCRLGRRGNYDVTADGKRFLMVKRAEGELSGAPYHFVLNWLEELKRRVPVRR